MPTAKFSRQSTYSCHSRNKENTGVPRGRELRLAYFFDIQEENAVRPVCLVPAQLWPNRWLCWAAKGAQTSPPSSCS